MVPRQSAALSHHERVNFADAQSGHIGQPYSENWRELSEIEDR